MRTRAFAGRFAARGLDSAPGPAELEAALGRDGEAASSEHGAFALAWTPSEREPHDAGEIRCLIEGRPRTAALAAEVGMDPTTPPERLVAIGYERVGEALLDRLDGAFALAIWDAERGRGLLARDRLGASPLFVTSARGCLLFASEIRNLLALLRTTPAPDPAAVAYWLARTDTASPRTLYSGIERLPAAHLLSLGPQGSRQRRHWRPRYSRPQPVDAGAAASEVRRALGRAVERAVAGAARPALMLSGGLDSAAIAAVHSSTGGRLAAYSCVFPSHEDVDESREIARVRDWLGIDGVEARFLGGSALAAGAEFIRAWEVPSVSPNLFVWLPLLRRAAADGVDMMLDGEGGDELFGCARYLVADRLRAGRPLAALRAARRLPGMGERPRPRWLGRALAAYGVRAALPPAAHERLRRARADGIAGPPWLSGAADRPHRAGADPWRWKRVDGPRWWAHLSHVLTAGPESLGAPEQMRRAGLLAGVEPRHPLRDPELVDLVLSLPPELAFDPRRDRPLARRALAGTLPAETLEDDRKPAFNPLLTDALAGPDRGALRDLLAAPHPDLAQRVRRDALRRMLDRPSHERPRAWALDIWRIASLEMWLRHRSGEPSSALEGPAATVSFAKVHGLSRQREQLDPDGGSVPT